MSSNPHDALFKDVFGDPAHARGALRSVMPPALAEALDWSSLARQPGSFVDPALREQHTDLLFSVTWRSGGAALIFFLFEHQSTVDPAMGYRLLRYQLRIWERWRATRPDEKRLPAILPVVLYHGTSPWSAPRSFSALFDLPSHVRPAIERSMVNFDYIVDDLSAIRDDELRARAALTALGKLVELCFKHSRNRDEFLELLEGWGALMHEVMDAPNGLEALRHVMGYILQVHDHKASVIAAVVERAAGPEAKEAIMTEGERLIQQGVQQGIQQGVQQGQRDLLLLVLKGRFGTAVDAEAELRLATASAEQLARWALRFHAAASLSELFAG